MFCSARGLSRCSIGSTSTLSVNSETRLNCAVGVCRLDHASDLLQYGERTGYLLKSRVTDVIEFTETLRRLLRGGVVIDPALIQELVTAGFMTHLRRSPHASVRCLR